MSQTTQTKNEIDQNIKAVDKSPKIIAVDFDGTITESREYTGKGIKHFSRPNPSVTRWIQCMHNSGNKIIVWTYRHSTEYDDIRRYCHIYGIPIDGINTNEYAPQEIRDYMDSPKIYADLYVDDRSFTLDDVFFELESFNLNLVED